MKYWLGGSRNSQENLETALKIDPQTKLQDFLRISDNTERVAVTAEETHSLGWCLGGLSECG